MKDQCVVYYLSFGLKNLQILQALQKQCKYLQMHITEWNLLMTFIKWTCTVRHVYKYSTSHSCLLEFILPFGYPKV